MKTTAKRLDLTPRQGISLIVLLAFYFLFIPTAQSCSSDSGYKNPIPHQPYVGDRCVYYDGRNTGLITSGPYRQLIISDDLLDGFAAIKGGTPAVAFTQWMTLASLGNEAANYNVGVMLHRGLGTTPDWVAALDFLKPEKQSTHYLSSDSYRDRILQQALIGLGFLSGKPDGDYGPSTNAAVDKALKTFSSRGGLPPSAQREVDKRRGQDDWFYYAIVAAFRDQRGWQADPLNPPRKPSAVIVTVPQDARRFTPVDKPIVAEKPPAVAQSTLKTKMSAQELFANRSKSVHMIFAADRLSSTQRLENLSQGSAVAVSNDTLVTNCHVIENKRVVVLIANGVPYPARRVAGSDSRDTCLIRSVKYRLTPITSLRRSRELSIGETVYAIGSPRGQENSLSQGILSGVRNEDGLSLLQTTAPISPGSSGGGLFDEYGNLVGVTTMTLRDSQSLNFAIAIEEFSR